MKATRRRAKFVASREKIHPAQRYLKGIPETRRGRTWNLCVFRGAQNELEGSGIMREKDKGEKDVDCVQ